MNWRHNIEFDSRYTWNVNDALLTFMRPSKFRRDKAALACRVVSGELLKDRLALARVWREMRKEVARLRANETPQTHKVI